MECWENEPVQDGTKWDLITMIVVTKSPTSGEAVTVLHIKVVQMQKIIDCIIAINTMIRFVIAINTMIPGKLKSLLAVKTIESFQQESSKQNSSLVAILRA
jgi:hypothetical protein